MKPEYLDAIRERLEPGSEEKHSHQYRAYARMLLSELSRVSADRDELRKALETIAAWRAFADDLMSQAREMPNCVLKHFREGSAGAYKEAADLARAALKEAK